MIHRTSPADLAARREQLRLRSAQLREQLAARTHVMRPAFRAADRVRGGVDLVQQNPALIALAGAAVAGALLVRPRAVVSVGLKLWTGWQTFHRFRPLINTFLRQLA